MRELLRQTKGRRPLRRLDLKTWLKLTEDELTALIHEGKFPKPDFFALGLGSRWTWTTIRRWYMYQGGDLWMDARKQQGLSTCTT